MTTPIRPHTLPKPIEPGKGLVLLFLATGAWLVFVLAFYGLFSLLVNLGGGAS
jgi:hypothetical protein